MGFLGVGRPIAWSEMTDEICDYIRLHGVIQFLYQYYARQRDEDGSVFHPLKWGEEIEYTLVAFDSDSKSAPARLSMRAADILEDLTTYSERSTFRRYCTWMPEYATWMLEATPGLPYGDLSSDLLVVEQAMQMRRHALRPFLHPLESVLSITVFPRIGCPDGLLNPSGDPSRGPVANSRYLPDSVINPHPRFGTLTANIRRRRGANVDVRVPLMLDANTRKRFPHLSGSAALSAIPQAPLRVCDDCLEGSATPAVVECTECELALCAPCDARIHSGRVSSTHARAALPLPSAASPSYRLDDGGIVHVSAAASPAVSPSGDPVPTRLTVSPAMSTSSLPLVPGSPDAPCPSGRLPEAQPVPELDAAGRPTIPLDAMAFGMGTSCLQCTFQCRTLSEARTLYDQLAVLTPYVTALSASSPVYLGLLADTDLRWGQIEASVDDRTPYERGEGESVPPLSAEAATTAATAAKTAGAAAAAAARKLFDAHAAKIAAVAAAENDQLSLAAASAAEAASAEFERAISQVKALSAGGSGSIAASVRGAWAEGKEGAAHNGPRRLRKSRYGTISLFVADDHHMRDEYNDLDIEIDQTSYEAAVAGGLDERLARHLAYTMVRDPLVVFSDRLQLDDTVTTEHYDNLASTNWNSMRLKLPPAGRDDIGWRVEFRPLEVQWTDFENAAFVIFVVLLSRIILLFDLNFYIPLSRVDENFRRAHLKGAATNQKFFVRQHVSDPASSAASLVLEGLRTPLTRARQDVHFDAANAPIVELTLDQIMNGCTEEGCEFPGLLPLCNNYLDLLEIDGPAREMISQYFELLSQRASGKLMTPATYIRQFVSNHRAYRGDSVVPQAVSADLLRTIQAVTEGRTHIKEMYGHLYPRAPDAPGFDKVPLIPDVPSGLRPPLVPVRHAGRALVTTRGQLQKPKSPNFDVGSLPEPFVSSSEEILRPWFANSATLSPVVDVACAEEPPLTIATPTPRADVVYANPLLARHEHLPRDLVRILLELRAFHPQFCAELGSSGPTMCNHAYMTLIALHQMGAPMETVKFWYENARFEPARAPLNSPTFTLTNWASHVGTGSAMFVPFRTFFDEILSQHTRAEVLAGTLPYLIRGAHSGMFHPFIRLSYALHDLDGGIADALAYCALRCRKQVIPRMWEAALDSTLQNLPAPWNFAAGPAEGAGSPMTPAPAGGAAGGFATAAARRVTTDGPGGPDGVRRCGALVDCMNIGSDPTVSIACLVAMANDRFQDRTFDSLLGLTENLAFVRLCGLLTVKDSTAEATIVAAARLAARRFEASPSFANVHGVIGGAAILQLLPYVPAHGYKSLLARVYVTFVVACHVIDRVTPSKEWQLDVSVGPSPDDIAAAVATYAPTPPRGVASTGAAATSVPTSPSRPTTSGCSTTCFGTQTSDGKGVLCVSTDHVSQEEADARWAACVREAVEGVDVHRITLVRAARLLSGTAPADPVFLRICEWQRRAARAF